MLSGALGDDDDDMHPQLAYDIARQRHAELTSHVGRHDSSTRVRFWRRRRRTAAVTPTRLVALPPPRMGRDPVGGDRRVA